MNLKDYRDLRRKDKIISLIVGCFDIIHIGHVNLFDFAKENSDILMVGLEDDKSIQLSKRFRRPVFNLLERRRVIRELRSVNYDFHIQTIYNFNSPNAHAVFESLVAQHQPDIIISAPFADRFWKKRVNTARKFNIKYLPYTKRLSCSTTFIINKLQQEM